LNEWNPIAWRELDALISRRLRSSAVPKTQYVAVTPKVAFKFQHPGQAFGALRGRDRGIHVLFDVVEDAYSRPQTVPRRVKRQVLQNSDAIGIGLKRNLPVLRLARRYSSALIFGLRIIIDAQEQVRRDRFLRVGDDLSAGRRTYGGNAGVEAKIEDRVEQYSIPIFEVRLDLSLAGAAQPLVPIELLAEVRLQRRDGRDGIVDPEPGGGYEALLPELLMVPIDFRVREQLVRQAVEVRAVEVELIELAALQSPPRDASPFEEKLRIRILLGHREDAVAENLTPGKSLSGERFVVSGLPIHEVVTATRML
jgi:hypothetical protein